MLCHMNDCIVQYVGVVADLYAVHVPCSKVTQFSGTAKHAFARVSRHFWASPAFSAVFGQFGYVVYSPGRYLYYCQYRASGLICGTALTGQLVCQPGRALLTSEHGPIPDRRTVPNGHVADERGVGSNERDLTQDRPPASVCGKRLMVGHCTTQQSCQLTGLRYTGAKRSKPAAPRTSVQQALCICTLQLDVMLQQRKNRSILSVSGSTIKVFRLSQVLKSQSSTIK